MTTHTQAVRRSGPSRPLLILLVAALGAATLVGVGCTPDIPTDPVPKFVELQFDPSSTPPKASQPTILTTNAETQLLDFTAAGIVVPTDPLACQTQTALSLASCEFYWYMTQLDGYPTLVPGRTPVSAPIDVATATRPGNVFIYNILGTASPLTAVDVSNDLDTGELVLDPQAGWDIGGLYFVALRGYANGLADEQGNEAVKSIIYVLLGQDTSLTCGAATAEAIAEDCAFYSLFTGDARFNTLPPAEMKAAIGATLVQLEQLRALYKGDGLLPFNVWDVVADTGQMPREEVGILWAFRTHTNSVIELNPLKGMVPVAASPTEIRLPVKGPIQTSTLVPFGFADTNGSVFLLDGTAFLAGDLGAALPTFTTTFADGDIVFTLSTPLVAGHQYIVLVSDQVEGKPGVPIVPSPVTVFLRSRGELVADFAGCAASPPTTTSLIPGFKPAEACQLEAGRQQFIQLLDDPTVNSFTTSTDRPTGLQREMVMYMYGFVYTAQ